MLTILLGVGSLCNSSIKPRHDCVSQRIRNNEQTHSGLRSFAHVERTTLIFCLGRIHDVRSNADTSAERAKCSVSAKAGRVRDWSWGIMGLPR